MNRISHSQATTWLSCQMKHLFAFDLALEPKPKDNPGSPKGLDKGVLGHDLLHVYYDSLRIGENHQTAMSNTRGIIQSMLMDNPKNIELISFVHLLLEKYWTFYEKDAYDLEILAVEKTFDLPISGEYSYVFKFDWMFREKATGKIGLVDNKFIYDFYTDWEINLSGQMPKYLGALRANGIYPDVVYLNQIRNRELKDPSLPLFKRAPVRSTKKKVDRALKEQFIISQEIVEWQALPIETRKQLAVRSSSCFPSPCKFCHFKKPCEAAYDGANIDYQLGLDFQPNSYNYNAVTTEGE